MHHSTTARAHRLSRHLRRRWQQRGQRGDVPGWVLITVMTIAIGAALWGIAEPQLTQILRSALNSVK